MRLYSRLLLLEVEDGKLVLLDTQVLNFFLVFVKNMYDCSLGLIKLSYLWQNPWSLDHQARVHSPSFINPDRMLLLLGVYKVLQTEIPETVGQDREI